MSGGIPLIRKPVLDPTQRAIRDLQADVADLEGAAVPVGTSVGLTGQGAAISTTNLVARAKSGIYRVYAVLQCTTGDVTAGTLALTIGWTDRVGATTDAVLTRLLTATGRNSRSYELQVAADTAVTYAVGITGIFATAVYALEVRTFRVSD